MVIISLPNEVDFETSPSPPVVHCSDWLRYDLLDRLRWEVFGSLHDVHVKDNIEDTLAPLAGHGIAVESLSNPPLSNISVYIDVCAEKEANDEHDEEVRYHAPEPLVINKEVRSPISMYDFVSQVHAYLNANKDEIWKCEDERYTGAEDITDLGDGLKAVGIFPGEDNRVWNDEVEEESTEVDYFWRSGNIPEGSRVFFDHVMINEVDVDEYAIYVGLFVEGNMGESLEIFWKQRNRLYMGVRR